MSAASHQIASSAATQSVLEVDTSTLKADLIASISKLKDGYFKGREVFNKVAREWWTAKTARSLATHGSSIGKTWDPPTSRYARWKVQHFLLETWTLTGQTRRAIAGAGLQVAGSRWKQTVGMPAYKRAAEKGGGAWYDKKHMTVHPWFIANHLRPIQTAQIPKPEMADLDGRVQHVMNALDAEIQRNTTPSGGAR